MAQQTAMQSLLTHLEMLKSKVDTVDIQSVINAINTSYLELEKEQIINAITDSQKDRYDNAEYYPPQFLVDKAEQYYNETYKH